MIFIDFADQLFQLSGAFLRHSQPFFLLGYIACLLCSLRILNGLDKLGTVNSVRVTPNREQVQIEKLLQVIEKNPSATQAYYAEQIGVSKRTVSRIFVSLQEKGILVQNGTKRKSSWVIQK